MYDYKKFILHDAYVRRGSRWERDKNYAKRIEKHNRVPFEARKKSQQPISARFLRISARKNRKRTVDSYGPKFRRVMHIEIDRVLCKREDVLPLQHRFDLGYRIRCLMRTRETYSAADIQCATHRNFTGDSSQDKCARDSH